MNSERLVSVLLFIGCIYGGVWSVIDMPDLIGVFAFLIVIAGWTVMDICGSPYEGDGESVEEPSELI